MKSTDKLLMLISELEAIEFAGLARVLKVKLVEEVNPEAETPAERYAARDFNDVLADVLKNFELSPRARRREILQLLKAIHKGGKDADNS